MDTMEFMRGDGVDHTFTIPTSAWIPGSRLFFAAKPAIDDDTTDGAALIQGNWSDEAVSDVTVTIDKVPTACKRYKCHFSAGATSGIASNGAESMDLLGEFQLVPPSADPITFPGPGDDRIPVVLYFDVKRATAV